MWLPVYVAADSREGRTGDPRGFDRISERAPRQPAGRTHESPIKRGRESASLALRPWWGEAERREGTCVTRQRPARRPFSQGVDQQNGSSEDLALIERLVAAARSVTPPSAAPQLAAAMRPGGSNSRKCGHQNSS
jgi:hypothetical protein